MLSRNMSGVHASVIGHNPPRNYHASLRFIAIIHKDKRTRVVRRASVIEPQDECGRFANIDCQPACIARDDNETIGYMKFVEIPMTRKRAKRESV